MPKNAAIAEAFPLRAHVVKGVFNRHVATLRQVCLGLGGTSGWVETFGPRIKMKQGLTMKKMFVAALLTAAFSVTTASAADLGKLVTKAPPPAPVSPWDIAFGSAIMSDYNFRGVTQSNHKPSVSAYFEPRYNFSDTLQAYIGVSAESISFPNRAAAEVDGYIGIRPTFGKLSTDFGFWYYWYPGGTCFNLAAGGDCAANADPATGGLPINGNVIKKDLSFYEIYAKASYAFTDALSAGASVYWTPSVLNSGADGTYVAGTAKYVGSGLPAGVGWYVSGNVGHWFLGTTDSFYGYGAGINPLVPAGLPGGIPFKSYTNWDVGVGFTYKVFTLDLRYYDTDLNKGDCNAFTSAQSASPGTSFTTANGFGGTSNWCGATFIAKLSADLTFANLK